MGSCALPPGPLPNAAGGQVGPVHMPLLRPGHVHAESVSFLLINHCENLCLVGAAGLAGWGCGAGGSVQLCLGVPAWQRLLEG